MANEKSPETIKEAKRAAEDELAKIEKYLSLIEREIERILLVQQVLASNSKLRGKGFN